MGRSTAAIVGLVGPAEQCSLRHTLPQIDALAAQFSRAAVVVVTQVARQEFNLMNATFNLIYVREPVTLGLSRTEKMARLRNVAMDAVQSLAVTGEDLEFVIWLDMDVWAIDLGGIADSFAHAATRNVVCAFGVTAPGVFSTHPPLLVATEAAFPERRSCGCT